MDDRPKFAAFIARANELFEQYRTTVYGVLPDTRDETSQRVNNEVLLGYTGLVVKRWNGEQASTPEWARKIDSRVNNNADAFEKDYYDAAFAAVKALVVELRIFSDDEVLRNPDAAVDHHLGEPRITADLHFGQ